jgi:uncharacterized surface protein with fasciclin (FAS1) repeats
MKYGSLIALLLVVVMAVTACAPVVTSPEAETQPTAEPQPTAAPMPAAPTMDIVDTAVSAGSFNTLVTAVQAAGLVDALKGEGPFTVFAPTDEAFAAVPAETLQALLADPEALSQVLLYHVLSGQVLAESVTDGLTADTLQGAPVAFTIMDGKAMINDANITATDILATNGVIHVIDKVILPPTDSAAEEPAAPTADIVDTAIAAGSFNTLVTAVQAAGLEEALRGEGPFTVFAPTDEAFAAVPAETLQALLADPEALSQVLLYHVLSGQVLAGSVTDGLTADTLQGAPVAFAIMDGKAMINDANIVATDVLATNGVIHVIDRVILPPAEAAAEEPAMAEMDIVDTAAAAGNFTTLLAAAEAAGLVDALRGEGPLTIFAPTDEAFAKLPAGTLESLLADPEALADILLYHVAEGKLTAKDVTERGFIPTLLGRPLAITAMRDSVKVNDANVIAADIEASNGIIHVIDTVLVPAGN